MALNGRAAERRGLKSEMNVQCALWQLSRDKFIQKWWRTVKNSPEDQAGIDFFVVYKRMTIPLQVKSSEMGAQRFERRGGVINCVVGQGDNLIPRIKQALREYRHRVLEMEADYGHG